MMKKNNFDIYKVLTSTDFKLRYQNSVLGILWVVLKPFLLFLVLYFVFSFLFGQKDPHYKLNLFLGIILMNYFIEGTTTGLYSIYWRANVLLKVNFKRNIILYAALSNAIISMIFNFIVFTIFWLIDPVPLTATSIILLLFYIILLTILILSLNFFLSILYIKFRDLSSIWEVITSMLFYFTPVIYPISVIPVAYQKYVLLNPLAVIITNSKEAVISQHYNFSTNIIVVSVFICILFFVGYHYFNKKIKKIAEDF